MSGYEVGYKKPPIKHQFQPGQSGNPKGAKPKQKRTEKAVDVVRRVCEEVFHHNGKSYTANELVLIAMRKKAMKGDNVAAKAFIALQRELGLLAPAAATGGGVLLAPAPMPLEEWEIRAFHQQAKFRGEDPEGLAALERGDGLRPRE